MLLYSSYDFDFATIDLRSNESNLAHIRNPLWLWKAFTKQQSALKAYPVRQPSYH